MAQVRWTLQAIGDVDGICEFIAREAPRTAKDFGRKLFGAAERLETFPLSGSLVPEFHSERLREIRVKKYRIIYRVLDEENVQILAVHHGSRMLDISLLVDD